MGNEIFLVTGERNATTTRRTFETFDEAKEYVDEERLQEGWLILGPSPPSGYIGAKWSIEPIQLGRHEDGS